jgi:transcription elongation factor Elf1
MPYLEYLFCEKCGNAARLDISPSATIDAYNVEGRKSSFINQATIVWDYLIYTCGICGKNYKYTFQDVERRVREYLSSLSEGFKEYIDEVIEEQNTQPQTNQRIQNLYATRK